MTNTTIYGTLTTDEMFQAEARKWAAVVATKMRTNAARFKHGKGTKRTFSTKKHNSQTDGVRKVPITEKPLRNSINSKLHIDRSGDFSRISFNFSLHGIFRAYGVGSGQPGETTGKKQSPNVRVKRSMSDWVSKPIENEIDKLADITANYYGDKILANIYGMNFTNK